MVFSQSYVIMPGGRLREAVAMIVDCIGFSKKKIILFLFNQRSFKSNCIVRVRVILNNQTDLIQNKGFISTIWFVYGMNYAQNSILNGLRGACCVWQKFKKL